MATKTLYGKIITPVSTQETFTDRQVTEFCFQDSTTGKRHDITLWHHVASGDSCPSNFRENDILLLRGFIGDDQSFIVKWFKKESEKVSGEAKGRSALALNPGYWSEDVEQLLSFFGGKELTRRYLEFTREQKGVSAQKKGWLEAYKEFKEGLIEEMEEGTDIGSYL